MAGAKNLGRRGRSPHFVMDGGPTINGKLTRLRPTHVPADLPFLQTLWNDGRVMRYVGFPAGLGMTEEKMDRWGEKCNTWTATHLIVETLSGAPVGESGWGFRNTAGMLEIKLAPSHWGRGYAADALEALIGYLWDRTTVDELVVEPHRDNRAARQLYRRLGFQPASPPGNLEEGYDTWTLVRPRPSSRPNTLLFDWGGVLMRTVDDSGRRKWETRLDLPAGTADEAVFGSTPWKRAQLGQCTVTECWDAIGDSMSLTAAELTQFRHDFWAGDRLNQALVQRIRGWKAAGYRVALLSNYSPELDATLDEQGVRSLFDPVVISAYEGVMKPASRLYWRALHRIGVAPAEALFVDDFASNVAGARTVGLHAVHFRDTQKAITEIEGFFA